MHFFGSKSSFDILKLFSDLHESPLDLLKSKMACSLRVLIGNTFEISGLVSARSSSHIFETHLMKGFVAL
jgi:hypothetical protein